MAKKGFRDSEEFKKYQQEWINSPERKDEKYLNSPEGHLMQAIYEGKTKFD